MTGSAILVVSVAASVAYIASQPWPSLRLCVLQGVPSPLYAIAAASIVGLLCMLVGLYYFRKAPEWNKRDDEKRKREKAAKFWNAFSGPPSRELVEFVRSQLRGPLGLERPEIRQELDRMERELAASQADPRSPQSPKRGP
jgi:hypothetical protein